MGKTPWATESALKYALGDNTFLNGGMMRMLNRFAVFLFGASLLGVTVIAQNGQPQTPPAEQTPPPAQATQPSPQPQQLEPQAEPIADPAKGALQPKHEPQPWPKIRILPEKKPAPIPAGALDKATPA
jgi:hypothetical protein